MQNNNSNIIILFNKNIEEKENVNKNISKKITKFDKKEKNEMEDIYFGDLFD